MKGREIERLAHGHMFQDDPLCKGDQLRRGVRGRLSGPASHLVFGINREHLKKPALIGACELIRVLEVEHQIYDPEVA
ncbi:MAG: hypothetical protein ACREXR_24155 [Gammaproteobacteria bacterium]